jgi:hypothetical protein
MLFLGFVILGERRPRHVKRPWTLQTYETKTSPRGLLLDFDYHTILHHLIRTLPKQNCGVTNHPPKPPQSPTLMSQKTPDAWDAEWTAETIESQVEPIESKKGPGKTSKAQKRAQQAEFNRQLWQQAYVQPSPPYNPLTHCHPVKDPKKRTTSSNPAT